MNDFVQHRYLARAKVTVSSLFFLALTTMITALPSQASAAGADVSVCNKADQKIRVALIDQYWGTGTEMLWKEFGWYEVSPGNCQRIKTIKIGWAAFAFSVGEKETFRPFIYTPSKTYNDSGQTPPRFSKVCVSETAAVFSRQGLHVSDVGVSCAPGATKNIPVSFKIYSDAFTNTKVTVNVERIPEFAEDHRPWASFIQDCVEEDLFGARSLFVCTCLSTELTQNFAKAELTFDYASYFTPGVKNAKSRFANAQLCPVKNLADEFVTSVNQRLVALGYQEWVEPSR